MAELSPDREFKTTASQAPTIVNGTSMDVLQLWLERTGQAEPPDFSRDLAVQLGKYLESFILDWMERAQQRRITRRQEFVRHPTLPWLSSTVDGVDEEQGIVMEVKVIGPFRKRHEFIRWYTPQLLVQMDCLGLHRADLCVLQTNDRIDRYPANITEDYRKEVYARLSAFQLCVDTMTPPVAMPELVPPEQWRTVDLASSNPLPNWGHAMMPTLRLWSDTRDTALLHKAANDDIKALLPDDVGEVLFNDITVKRNRAGAVSIKKDEAA